MPERQGDDVLGISINCGDRKPAWNEGTTLSDQPLQSGTVPGVPSMELSTDIKGVQIETLLCETFSTQCCSTACETARSV